MSAPSPATTSLPPASAPAADRPLRVLFIASFFPRPGRPAMGPWALEQAQALQRAGLDVQVFAPTAWVPRWAARTPGARVYAECPPTLTFDTLRVDYPRWLYYPVGPMGAFARRWPGPALRLAWRSIRRTLHATVQSFRPDVLFVHHTLPNGYLAYRLRRAIGLPYLLTDHSFDDIVDCARMPSRRHWYGRVAEAASVVIAVSQRMATDRRRLFPLVNTQVVHNGANPPPANLPPRPPELAGKKVVACVSVLYRRKGVPLLVEAFAEVRRHVPNAVLRIVGDGPDRAEVEAAIRRHHVEGCVTMLGAQPRSRVAEELNWCDLFALIGWDEPWGVVFAEAAAAGKPVVCCNDGGVNDVIQNGVHGITVPPHNAGAAAEALISLLQNEPTRRAMGRAAQTQYDQSLSWDSNAQHVIAAMKTAIADVRRSGSAPQGVSR